MQSIEDFKEVVEILRAHKIEIWADLGALLGFERERSLLEWEEDIDCGTLVKPEAFADIDLQNALMEKGWKCFNKYKGLAIQNGKTKIDIKFYTEEDDSVYAYFVVYKHRWILPICDLLIWGLYGYKAEDKYETTINSNMLRFICFIVKLPPLTMRKRFISILQRVYYNYGLKGHKIKFPRSWILPLCVKTIDGFPFRIPAQPKKILELTYGDNWKKPQKIIPGTDRYPDGSSRYLTVRVIEKRPDLVEVEKYA